MKMSSPNLPPLPDLSDCGIENWNVVMLEGLLTTYGKACAVAERDCRTCFNYTTKSGGCVSIFQCVDGAQYKITPPRQYWIAGHNVEVTGKPRAV
jgi:hypothetical protein